MDNIETKENLDLFHFHNLYDGSILLSYKGPMEENILASMGRFIRVISPKDKIVSNRIFKIFMELATNISFYSAEYNNLAPEKKAGVGSMMIVEDQELYYFYCGNIVKTLDIIPIIDKCEVINSLDRESLREFKRKQRRLPRSEFGGSNIGLIQIALTSDQPLDIKVTPIDDLYAYFSVCVKISGLEEDGDIDNEV